MEEDLNVDSAKLAPVCLFTYNRLWETIETVTALRENFLACNSELFVFSDSWKGDLDREEVLKVRKFISTIEGFKRVTVIESDVNKGLARSIIGGVTDIVKVYGKVIVLEDDLITTRNFLNFMNEALDFYANEKVVQSINGFSIFIQHHMEQCDVYFQKRPFSWGWATWSDRWSVDIFDKDYIQSVIQKDLNVLKDFRRCCGDDISEMLTDSLSGRNNSWYVRWTFDHFITGRVSVYPFHSKVMNIGFSEYATHCKGINVYRSNVDKEFLINFVLLRPQIDEVIVHQFLNTFTKLYKVNFRLNLLFTTNGRKTVFNELMNRCFN